MRKGKFLVGFGVLFVFMILLTACFGSDETDWTSGEITVNGTEITLPFSYQDIGNINCSTADQYYNNISDQYVFNVGESESQLVVMDTVKNGYLSLGCANIGGTPCTLPNITVYSIAADARSDKTKVDLVLPGDITWGATVEDIKDAYGEPNGAKNTQAREYEAQTKMTRMVYSSGKDSSQTIAGAYSMVLEIHDEKGLQKLEYSVACQNISVEDETAGVEKRVLTHQPVSADISSLQKKWQQPSVQFGNKSFGFPLTVADLTELGFSFSDEGKRAVFNPENTESRTMSSEKYGEIIVDLINMDEELRTPDTIWVDEIVLNADKLKDPSQIKVTGGIGFGSDVKDVTETFQGGPEAIISDYKEGDTIVGENYEYSLASVATEQSLYSFDIHSEKGVQRISIKKHRPLFSESIAKTQVSDNGITKAKEENSNLTSSVKLPQEVADQYEKARYYILKKDSSYTDSYLIAGAGEDISLNENMLSTELKSNVVIVADKTAGKKYDTSVYLKEETEEARVYVTNAILQRDSIALGGHHDTQTLDAAVTVMQDKKSGNCKPIEARINNEDLSAMASRVQLDLNRFSGIRYGVTLYTPKKKGDGSLMPVAEWKKHADVEYSDYVPGNEYEIQLQNVSREGEYAIVYEVTYKNGQVYVSDIQEIN